MPGRRGCTAPGVPLNRRLTPRDAVANLRCNQFGNAFRIVKRSRLSKGVDGAAER